MRHTSHCSFHNDPSTCDCGCFSRQLRETVTLRDRFAMTVIGDIYAAYVEYTKVGSVDPTWRMGIAVDAYLIADAMMKAREGK